MILYHGSNTTINDIDLNKCHLYKDFGQAFYLTEDKAQASVIANARVALLGGDNIINKFKFDEEKLKDGTLSYLSFEGYTEEWADFIFKHRDDTITPPYMHNYDVVYGPIANDRVGMQIRNLRMGFIDMKEFMRRLHYMKGITYQWAFCTEKAIKYLERI